MKWGAFEAAETKLREWRAEPCKFVWEVFGATPDKWQERMLREYAEWNRVVAIACKGPGKTTGLSWCGWHTLALYPNSKVPCTSITGPNLKDGLWAELAKWQQRSDLLRKAFNWTQTRISNAERPETWFASFRTWAQDADPQQQANTLAGLHEDYLTFLLDEVSDCTDGLVYAAEAALASGVRLRLVMAGNATRTEGPLYRAVTTDRHKWRVVKITGDPDDPERSPRINIDEARALIEEKGREDYIVRVNILGEFPLRQADKLLDVSDCEKAIKRSVPESLFAHEAKIIGVDVARFGDDAAVFAPRQGRMAFPYKEFRNLDTQELGEQLIRAIEKWGAHKAFVDSGAMGPGVIDHCRHHGYGHIVEEVNFGGKAADSDRYENKRAEMYGNMAEWVKKDGSLPPAPMLTAELAAPVFWYDKKQRMCLEPKADIKSRLGRSPDRSDAYALTFASPVRPPAPKHRLPFGHDREKARDFDPYDERRM